MKRLFTYLTSPSRCARVAWGTNVNRWTIILALVGLPIFLVAGTLTVYSGAENAKLVFVLCAIGALLTLLPMLMQAKDVTY